MGIKEVDLGKNKWGEIARGQHVVLKLLKTFCNDYKR